MEFKKYKKEFDQAILNSEYEAIKILSKYDLEFQDHLIYDKVDDILIFDLYEYAYFLYLGNYDQNAQKIFYDNLIKRSTTDRQIGRRC